MNGVDHFARAEELLAEVDAGRVDPSLVVLAQAHATLAVAAAIETWRPPQEQDPPPPEGQTKDTWKW